MPYRQHFRPLVCGLAGIAGEYVLQALVYIHEPLVHSHAYGGRGDALAGRVQHMGDLRPIRGVIPLGEDLAVAQQHCGMYAQLGGIIGKVPEEPLHYRAGKARLLRGAARQGFPCGQKGKAPHLTRVAVGGYAIHVPFKHFDEQLKAAHLNGNVHFSSGY